MPCLAPVYFSVSLRPQRLQRISPARSASPCLRAPGCRPVGMLLLTILRIASALSQPTYPSCAFGISASQSVRALRRAFPLAPRPLYPDSSAVVPIGGGPAVDRVIDHSVDGGVVGTPPGRVPVVLLHRQIEIVLMEPATRLRSCGQ